MTTQQLSLQLSVTASAALQEELARWTEYARDEHARAEEMTREAESFAEECDSLRTALQTAEAKALAMEREMIHHRTMADYYQGLLAMMRAGVPGPPLAPTLSKDALTTLLKIAHPDRWQTRPASELAHELSVTINQMRKGVQA